MIPLTPAVRTPLPQRRQKGIPSPSSKDARKKTPLTATVRDLIESELRGIELSHSQAICKKQTAWGQPYFSSGTRKNMGGQTTLGLG